MIEFNNALNSYLLCRYDKNNSLTMNTCFFSTINDAYEHIMTNFNFIKSKNFLESYDDYLNNNHIKNGHNMLFPKDYVFSFEYDKSIYELYKIIKNSNYVLLIFDISTQLVGYTQGFDTHSNALEKMKIEYRETFDETFDNDINLIKHNDFIFGMIFECKN